MTTEGQLRLGGSAFHSKSAKNNSCLEHLFDTLTPREIPIRAYAPEQWMLLSDLEHRP